MGMFDEVYCEADLPTGHPAGQRSFPTKSLFRLLDRVTITKEGRLVLHSVRYEHAEEEDAALPLMTPIPQGDIDLEFHGDLRLTSTVEDQWIEYAARFTHGILEWIRPWSELSEIHQALLTPD